MEALEQRFLGGEKCYQISTLLFGEHTMEWCAKEVEFGGGFCFDLMLEGKERRVVGS